MFKRCTRSGAGAVADLFQIEGRGDRDLKGAKGGLLVLSDTAPMWYLQSRLR